MFQAQDLGRTIGFFTFGPFGAMYGGAIGKSFDNAFGFMNSNKGTYKKTVKTPINSEVQKAFFTSTFRIMGDVFLKCGFHRMNELKRLHNIMEHMELTMEHRLDAVNNYYLGQKKAFNAQNQINKLLAKCEDNKHILKMFVEIQLQAICDEYHDYNQTGIEAIKQLAELISISEYELAQIQTLVKSYISHSSSSSKKLTKIQEEKNAYKMLGLDRNASIQEVKTNYKQLISQHHPDKLIGKGMPSDMAHIAAEKIKEINEAYKLIMQHKRLN
ncbi:MAG: co-chaperone DjlA [Gammaproteobacteria bacterium]|nr:MAG: co-chaperone DjlA [Gammaproteobacteria bacterium]